MAVSHDPLWRNLRHRGVACLIDGELYGLNPFDFEAAVRSSTASRWASRPVNSWQAVSVLRVVSPWGQRPSKLLLALRRCSNMMSMELNSASRVVIQPFILVWHLVKCAGVSYHALRSSCKCFEHPFFEAPVSSWRVMRLWACCVSRAGELVVPPTPARA